MNLIPEMEEVVLDYLVDTKKNIRKRFEAVLQDIACLGMFTSRRGHILGHRFIYIAPNVPVNRHRRTTRRLGIMVAFMRHKLAMQERVDKEFEKLISGQ